MAHHEGVRVPLISWKSVFAGLFVSFLVYSILLSLGMAIGGLSLVSVIQARDGQGGLAVGGGAWIIVSALISLFAGSYFAGRVSNFITTRIGAAQGLVIASMFFVAMLIQAGMTLGLIGSGVGATASLAGDVVDNPQVKGVLERSIAERADLKSDPDVVLKGLAVRLVRGDREAARNYLAYQTGMTPAEADQKIAQVENDFKANLEQAGITAARVISGIGWSMFGLFFLGTLFSAFGGGFGARANQRHPFYDEIQAESLRPAFQT